MRTHVANGKRYEYAVEPTEGFTLGDGRSWWGSHVRWRIEGTRRWQRFNLIDAHSWDAPKITAAIEAQDAK